MPRKEVCPHNSTVCTIYIMMEEIKVVSVDLKVLKLIKSQSTNHWQI